MKSAILSVLAFFAVNAYSQSWKSVLPEVGTFSSPRVTDLNQDGIDDIVIGAGRLEFQSSDSAILALDGSNGEILWKKKAKDQIFGSAALLDIDRDGIDDILIGGRSAELQAISGATGKTIWKFRTNRARKATGERLWFNFYNPQLIPDQNGDGLEDILISNGGDVMVEAYDPERPPGYLMVLDAAEGGVLSLARMPDGRETYMSVAAVKQPGDEDHHILFGTGGETVGGNFYVATLSQVMSGDLSGAVRLDSCAEKGYIAPPVWTDLNLDGYFDAVVNTVDGRVLAFDGYSYERLWEVKTQGTEAYSSFAVGYFNNDDTPDLFVSFARGVWPELHATRQFMLNGSDGSIEFEDSVGFYQTTSPVASDLNDDGVDEVIMSVNYQSNDIYGRPTFYNMLVSVNFTSGEVNQLTDGLRGHNVASTPWIGDLDQDGKLDIIYAHSTNKYSTYAFDGMQVNRVATDFPVYRKVTWGSYMGSRYDGIFRGRTAARKVNNTVTPLAPSGTGHNKKSDR